MLSHAMGGVNLFMGLLVVFVLGNKCIRMTRLELSELYDNIALYYVGQSPPF